MDMVVRTITPDVVPGGNAGATSTDTTSLNMTRVANERILYSMLDSRHNTHVSSYPGIQISGPLPTRPTVTPDIWELLGGI